MQPSIIWHRYHALMQLPAAAKPWLLEKGSLTARLVEYSQGQFAVQRIEQHWAVPMPDETKALGLRHREKALIREVYLLCHGEALVYARSVMPLHSLHGPLRFLKKLQNTSLGSLLFKDPHLSRGEFEICQIALPHRAIPAQGTQSIYGRRSVFRLYRQPILVSEFFLPACPFYHSGNDATR